MFILEKDKSTTLQEFSDNNLFAAWLNNRMPQTLQEFGKAQNIYYKVLLCKLP